MIKYFKKNNSGNVEEIKSFEEGSLIEVINPNFEETEFIFKKFNIDKDNLGDALDIYENPRVEEIDGNIYFFLETPTEKLSDEPTSSFMVVIGNKFVMIISKSELELFEDIKESKLNLKELNFRGFLISILFCIERRYEKNVHKIIKDMKYKRRDLKEFTNEDFRELLNKEYKLNDYLSTHIFLLRTYQKIFLLKSLRLSKDEKVFIKDLINDLTETFSLAKATLKNIKTFEEYYFTNLTNKLNKIITILTIVTVFINVPGVIAAMYGMNVPLPFQDTKLFFYIFSGIVLLFWTSSIILLKKLKMFK